MKMSAEMKKVSNQSENIDKKRALNGYIAVILGTFGITAYAICFKRVIFNNTFLTPFQGVIIRCVVQLIMISIIMAIHRIKPTVKDRKTSMALFGLSAAKIIQAILGVAAFAHLSVGSSTILFAMLPIFTLFFSRLILDRTVPALPFTILAIVCFLGAVCVAYPSIASSPSSVRSDNDTGLGYATAIIYVAFAAIFDALYLVFGKMVSEKVDYELTMFYTSILGLIVLPITMLIFQMDFYLAEISDIDWYLLLAGSVAMFINAFLTAFAFPRVPPGPMAMMFLLDITWGYIYDIFVRHLTFHPLSIFGIFVIIVSCVLTICIEVYKWDLSLKNIWTQIKSCFQTIFSSKDI